MYEYTILIKFKFSIRLNYWPAAVVQTRNLHRLVCTTVLQECPNNIDDISSVFRLPYTANFKTGRLLYLASIYLFYKIFNLNLNEIYSIKLIFYVDQPSLLGRLIHSSFFFFFDLVGLLGMSAQLKEIYLSIRSGFLA